MLRMMLFLVVFTTGVTVILAQSVSSVRVAGQVIDSLTGSPVPDVHIKSRKYGTTSDHEGKFTLEVSEGEELSFSHVNYHPRTIRFSGLNGEVLVVTLLERVAVLKDVTVRDFLSEDDLKRKVMETSATMSEAEVNAAENSKQINQLGRIAPVAPPTREELFFESLQGPKDVTIFSTKPGQGLIGAIRKISAPPRLKEYTPPSRYESDPKKVTPFKIRLHSTDTVSREEAIRETAKE